MTHAPDAPVHRCPRGVGSALLVGLACMLVSGRAMADERAETNFSWDLRVGGYFAASTERTAWAALGGVQFGAIHWFQNSNLGLQFLAGPQAGYMSTSLGVLGVTGDAGVIFNVGSYRGGTSISLNWAPKLLADFGKGFAKGEVSSPFGAEVGFNFSGFEIPLWALQTLDGTTMIGIAFGLAH